jgi:hypothetical protein
MADAKKEEPKLHDIKSSKMLPKCDHKVKSKDQPKCLVMFSKEIHSPMKIPAGQVVEVPLDLAHALHHLIVPRK